MHSKYPVHPILLVPLDILAKIAYSFTICSSMLHLSHSPHSDDTNITLWKVISTKVSVMQFSPASHYVLSLSCPNTLTQNDNDSDHNLQV